MKYLKRSKWNEGMTYIELIVVLGIFSIMAGISSYNYGKFQEKVGLTNLASEIALKAQQAQKDSLSGRIPVIAGIAGPSSNWKPSYGLFFNTKATIFLYPNYDWFLYFADLNNDNSDAEQGLLAISDTNGSCGTPECLEIVKITKGNRIISFRAFFQDGTSADLWGNVSLLYTRGDSGLKVYFGPSSIFTEGVPLPNLDHVEITVMSPHKDNLLSRVIKLYSSGRIQIE